MDLKAQEVAELINGVVEGDNNSTINKLSKIENGEGTLGQFINDDKMYNNLERATKQMEELMQDIKLNPKRYVHFSVFGKNPGPYEEPKDSLR